MMRLGIALIGLVLVVIGSMVDHVFLVAIGMGVVVGLLVAEVKP